jgi:hypothetical protein
MNDYEINKCEGCGYLCYEKDTNAYICRYRKKCEVSVI